MLERSVSKGKRGNGSKFEKHREQKWEYSIETIRRGIVTSRNCAGPVLTPHDNGDFCHPKVPEIRDQFSEAFDELVLDTELTGECLSFKEPFKLVRYDIGREKRKTQKTSDPCMEPWV